MAKTQGGFISKAQFAQIVSKLDAKQFGGYCEIELIMAKDIPGAGRCEAYLDYNGSHSLCRARENVFLGEGT